MHNQPRQKPVFPPLLLAASLLFCAWPRAAITAAPAPVVDTEPPTNITIYDVNNAAVVAAVEFPAPRPVITLDMKGAVAARVVATDAPNANSTSTDFPGYPTGTIGPLTPGRHILTWTATDLGNNSFSTGQIINVKPQVSFAVDQTVGEGNTVKVTVYLSGDAPSLSDTPPTDVLIPFSIDGAGTTATDYTVVTPSPLHIQSGRAADIIITTGTGNADKQTIKLDMGAPTGAVSGDNLSHTVTLTESNLAPIVNIDATQGGAPTRAITSGGGEVTLRATARDPNDDDISGYDWSASDGALVPTGGTTSDTFTFNPTGLTPGIYTARLTVSDGSITSTRDMPLRLYTTPPTLSASDDSDDDGKKDSAEGIEDGDGDGIPNYLDAVDNPAWLPGWDLLTYKADLKRSDTFVSGPITFSWQLDKDAATIASNRVYYPLLLATEAGLKLSVGPTAFANGRNNGRIDTAAAALHFGSSLESTLVSADGQVVDVEISGLGTTGQSVYLVIPQAAPLPPGSPLFKVMGANRNWINFVNEGGAADSKNTLLYTGSKSSDNYCDPPGNGSYIAVASGSSALNNGISCIELLVQDGGPNDYDGQANGIIRLLGAPFVNADSVSGEPVIPSEFNGSTDESVESLNKLTLSHGGGGVGFIGAWGIAGLLLAHGLRRRQTQTASQ